MQELITIDKDGVAVVDSTTIADGVKVEHRAVLQLIRKYIPDFEAFGRVAFEMRPFGTAGGMQKKEVAWLNEDQTTLLFTFLKNTEIARKLKIRLVQAFRQCRDELAKSRAQQIPQSLPEALRLAADLAEKNQALALKVKEDEPKISYLDRIMAANGSMTITNAAKVIGYPPRKLKDYMRQIGFLYASADTPKQEHILAGRAVLRYAHWTDSNGNPQEKPYCHLTAKGLQYICEKLAKDGLLEPTLKFDAA